MSATNSEDRQRVIKIQINITPHPMASKTNKNNLQFLISSNKRKKALTLAQNRFHLQRPKADLIMFYKEKIQLNPILNSHKSISNVIQFLRKLLSISTVRELLNINLLRVETIIKIIILEEPIKCRLVHLNLEIMGF